MLGDARDDVFRAVHVIDHAGRKADLVDEFNHSILRKRHLFTRLDDDGVARGNAEGKKPKRHHGREVVRSDGCEHAHWLALLDAVDPAGDLVTFTFDWGDGSDPSESVGGVVRHTYPDGVYRAYTLTVTASDGNGGSVSTQIEVDFPEPAANQPPTFERVEVLSREGFQGS